MESILKFAKQHKHNKNININSYKIKKAGFKLRAVEKHFSFKKCSSLNSLHLVNLGCMPTVLIHFCFKVCVMLLRSIVS